MEVEVKLRLPNSNAHQRLSTLLSPHHLKTHFQENIFFDTTNSLLSTNLAALRLRFYDLDTRCIISLKAKPMITQGVSIVQEDEEVIDPSIGRACMAHPCKLLLLDSSRIIERVKEEYDIGDDSEMECEKCV
ncbi:hypothetical protein Leryth_022036 [Lithospermum erythrorhizon]|nr:hypothetical protein Leryth_022036 [Lithospermum erythrorhizon]